MITIVKPIGNFCNLRCLYCFYAHLDQNHLRRMSNDLLKKLTRDLSEVGNPKVTVIWHGGEPLLAGLEFYQLAVEEQSRYPYIQFDNRLQTNAILLDEEWIAFFKEHGFGIGISLDGTRQIHDQHRKDAGQNPTFDRIMKNIGLMREADLKFGLIQTTTAKSIPFVRESQEFFYQELGLRSWNVNFVDRASCPENVSSDPSIALSDDDLCQVYDELIDFWLASDDRRLIIDELDQFVAAALGRKPRCCHFRGCCGNFSCVDYDGSVYPCDRLCSSPEDAIGNLQESNMSEIMNGDRARKFRINARVLHPDCLVCKWQPFCNNGCTAMRDSNGKYRHCEVRRKIFDRVSLIVNNYGSKGGECDASSVGNAPGDGPEV
jgi:uncharacterized protein